MAEIDARRVVFRTRLFGFDKAEVRAFLSNLLSEYVEARAGLESALAREPGTGLPPLRLAVQLDDPSAVDPGEDSAIVAGDGSLIAAGSASLVPPGAEPSALARTAAPALPSDDVRAARATDRVAQMSAGQADQERELSRLVERTLTSAHRVADEIRRDAEQEAERLVREAEQGAERLLTDARTRSDRLIEKAAAEGTEKHEAALTRLRETEQEIERMQACHRELRAALESMVTALGEALADTRARSLLKESADAAPVEPMNQAAGPHPAIRVLAS